MTNGPRRARRWAGDRLRQLVAIGTRDLVSDMESRLRLELDAIQGQLTEIVAASDRRSAAQYDQIRSVTQSLKYLSLSSMSTRAGPPDSDLTTYEMRVFSQNGEDGVLLEILRRIGAQSRRFIEVGAQAAEANCLALALILGWQGTVVEADAERAEAFRRTHALHGQVAVVESFVTSDNINDVAGNSAVDVLSLDIDGNDYWVWSAFDRFAPRVVIVEYNARLDPARALVQPYDPHWVWPREDFFGASRGAMVRLGLTKGYRLVHAETSGANLFFVRRDLVDNHFLAADDVAVRTPNYFLTATSHPAATGTFEYIDLDRS